MDAGSLPGWANVWSRGPRYGDGHRDVLALRIAGFPVFRLLSHCYFSWARRRRELQAAALRTTPDCRRRLTYWRHDESRLGPARTCAAEKKKFHGWGMAAVVFRCCLQCGLWRIPLATTAQKDDRRRGVPVHAYLNSSFRFVDFTSAPQ